MQCIYKTDGLFPLVSFILAKSCTETSVYNTFNNQKKKPKKTNYLFSSLSPLITESAEIWLYSLSCFPHCHSMNKNMIDHSGSNFILRSRFLVLLFFPMHHLLHTLVLLCLSDHFHSLLVSTFNPPVQLVHSELDCFGFITSLARSVNNFESLFVSYNICAVTLFAVNFCHLWLLLCITSASCVFVTENVFRVL